MKLKVENTETGEVVNIRLVPTVVLFKFEVSLMFPIPPHEQIILYGPPYKVIDSVYLDILKQCYGGSSSSGTNSPSINDTIRNGNNVYRFGFDNDNNNNNSNNNYQGNNKNNSNNVPDAIITSSPSPNIDSLSSSSSLLSPIQTKRCFLYNRKILASDDKDFKQIRLLPLKPNPLSLSDIQSPIGLNRSGSGSRGGYMNSEAMTERYEHYYKSILQGGVNYEMFITDR